MRFISNEEYRDLCEFKRIVEDEEKEINKVRKSYNRQIDQIKESHEDQVTQIKRDHKKVLQTTREEADKKVDTATRAADKAERKLKRSLEDAEEFKAVIDKTANLEAKEIELKTLETKLDAREKLLDHASETLDEAEAKITEKIEAQAKAVVNARNEGLEIGEKKGYANGASDMAREIKSQNEKAQDNVYKLAEKVIDKPVPEVKILQTESKTTVNNSI